MIPMGPTYGRYPGDFDRNSSGKAWGKPDWVGWGFKGAWGIGGALLWLQRAMADK